jgi:hypothetical protein
MSNSKKFFVTWEKNGQKLSGPFSAESREAAEQFIKDRMPGAENVYARTLVGVLDERIREHIKNIRIDIGEGRENDKYAIAQYDQIKERLRCCADAAYMFGEDSQQSLERTLGRMVEAGWAITGLDSHMFSFWFKSKSFHGGIIFHCSAKEWSSHT